MNELQYQIALTLIPQIGPVTAKTLVGHCGSAENVFRATRKELLKIPGIGAHSIAYLHSPEALRMAEQELRFLEDYGIETLFYSDKKYPFRLSQCYDAPILLYYKGNDAGLLNGNRVLSVVGTRQPSDLGRALCEEIIEGLRPYNVLVVSGLAYGIDITAHRKASAVNMPNVGVLGHGLGSIYPNQHRSTALKMIENGGLLSEYLHQVKPEREHFPMRNRIIAGLCDALLVVETAASGGSMITANMAFRNDREIFALPGRPSDTKSAGCNFLIRNQQAALVESAAHIAAAMRWDEGQKPRAVQIQLMLDLPPEEQRLIDLIRSTPEIAIDHLAISAGLSSGALAARILTLEFKGLVRTLPGKRYVVV
jgi:DNA processing protein